jgi:hypothetical protein
MKLVHGDGPEWHEDDVQRALVSHYRAPADESYWGRLEHSIMSRVRGDTVRDWWAWFPEWVRLGVVAAAAAILVAAIAAWQTRAAQERMAYREILDAPTEIPILTERTAPVERDRDQTLRYLLSR